MLKFPTELKIAETTKKHILL